MEARQHMESLIAALERSVEAGLSYFQGPGGQAKVRIGRWGPREVLCHLVWWHQATVEGMESVLAGGAPYRIYASVDEMNARAVGRLAGKNIAQLADLVRQFQARLVKAARALPDPQATVLVLGDGSGRSVQQRLETIAHHWDEHVKELQVLGAA
jgi:Mycothiol maleylpyruvate isomerase N-terminal domain